MPKKGKEKAPPVAHNSGEEEVEVKDIIDDDEVNDGQPVGSTAKEEALEELIRRTVQEALKSWEKKKSGKSGGPSSSSSSLSSGFVALSMVVEAPIGEKELLVGLLVGKGAKELLAETMSSASAGATSLKALDP